MKGWAEMSALFLFYKKEYMEDSKKLSNLIRHIKNVQDNCSIISEKLIENNEFTLAKNLLANSLIHDNSKFYGIEFDYLTGAEAENKELLMCAIAQHNTNPLNKHHPEFWVDIKEMPRLYVAEMVADCTARASEFGTDIREWFKECATKKYKFSTSHKIWGEIKDFLDMLLDKPFRS